MSPQDRIGGLTEREREILQLKCEGADYKTIAERLIIGLPTVKHHMGNIFVKLGLDHLHRDARSVRLHQIYCPILQKGLSQPPPPEPENPAPLPESVVQAVEEDEMPLVIYTPPRREEYKSPPAEPPVIFIGTNSSQGSGGETGGMTRTVTTLFSKLQLWLVPGAFLLGMIVTSIAFLLLVRNNNLSAGTIISPTPMILVAQVTVLVTTTPEPTQVVTPVIIEPQAITVEVVVTATPLPATEPPTPPLETATQTNTPEPTITPTASLVLPFQDNFDQGLRSEWRVMSGQPVLVNGRLQSISWDTLTLQLGDSLTNYTIGFYFETCHDNAGETTIIIGGRVRFLLSRGDWAWEGFQDNRWVLLPGSPFDASCEGDVQVRVSGNSYTVSVNGGTVLESIYGTPTIGPVTVTMYGPRQVIDNFSLIGQ